MSSQEFSPDIAQLLKDIAEVEEQISAANAGAFPIPIGKPRTRAPDPGDPEELFNKIYGKHKRPESPK